jgi:ferric enterobactin receptor
MRYLLVVLTLLLLSVGTNAQVDQKNETGTIVTGQVVDSISGAKLEYATISVIDSAGKTITGATTNATGKFSMPIASYGRYDFLLESIGYAPKTLHITVRDKETRDLGKLTLRKSAQDLAAVTVTARAKLIDNKIDKMVFNAERDITSQTGVATDVLKKIPQVSVDVDGNVQLAGNGSIRFLINGKPSNAYGANITDVLQSIPANQIKSVEVITNPGARYDAQGLGGIINIILKQNNARGVNGSLSTSVGTRNDNGSFNFTARRDKLGVNAFVSGNYRRPVSTKTNNSRTSFDDQGQTISVLKQVGQTELTRQGAQMGGGFDYTFNDKNSISASLNYGTYKNKNEGLINQDFVTDLQDQQTINTTGNRSRFHYTTTSFNYKKTFDKEDQSLDFNFSRTHSTQLVSSFNEQRLQPVDSLFYGVRNTNPAVENEMEMTLDYAQPFSKTVNFGTGLKTNFDHINTGSDALSLDGKSAFYAPDASLTNHLVYDQKVYAAYAELSFPVAKLFDMKVGGRYERTEIDANYSNAQQNVAINGYNTFVPSVYFSKKLGETQNVKLSYSKRIGRPDYNDLNPFINTSDPKNINSGNPYLLPELGYRIELAYSLDLGGGSSLMVSTFYRRNRRDIQPYVKFYSSLQIGDSVYQNVSVSTRENIGTEDNTGLNIFGDVKLTSKLSARGNVFLFHRHIYNEIDAGSDRSSFNYRFNINATYLFTSTLGAEFFGNFSSARNEVQGRYPSFTTYNFAIRKQFWNKKASLALTTTNPFNEYLTQRVELFGTNFTSSNIRKIPFRSFGLNFTWKFGLLEFKKEPTEDTNGGGVQM